jgi:2-methylisocitrate lyase-like PEP mutase family enzyme
MTASFRDLHDDGTPLVLPNAWDVPSALAFVDAGFVAVGTTSFGVVASHGHPDGARHSMQANVRLAAALASLNCFVSVDIEDGYADDPGAVADYVARLDLAGVNIAGVNIEDSCSEALISPEAHAAKVAAVKSRCPEVFVNARVDTYWLGQDAALQPTLDRARRYVEAGADGIFVPGVADEHTVRELCALIDRPVNVLASPDVSVSTLADWGVRRVSTGSLPYRAAMAAATQAALAVRDGGPIPAATPYGQLQSRLLAYHRGR